MTVIRVVEGSVCSGPSSTSSRVHPVLFMVSVYLSHLQSRQTLLAAAGDTGVASGEVLVAIGEPLANAEFQVSAVGIGCLTVAYYLFLRSRSL